MASRWKQQRMKTLTLSGKIVSAPCQPSTFPLRLFPFLSSKDIGQLAADKARRVRPHGLYLGQIICGLRNVQGDVALFPGRGK